MNRSPEKLFIPFEATAEALADVVMGESGGAIPEHLKAQVHGMLVAAAHDGIEFHAGLVEAGILESTDPALLSAEVAGYAMGMSDVSRFYKELGEE